MPISKASFREARRVPPTEISLVFLGKHRNQRNIGGRVTRPVDLVHCPACGQRGMTRGWLGGACRHCGATARDQALEEAGYDRYGRAMRAEHR
jgi:tRNA(Ile2) C34 agmatinyltransferase TiaS